MITPFYLKFADKDEAYAVIAKIMLASKQATKIEQEETPVVKLPIREVEPVILEAKLERDVKSEDRKELKLRSTVDKVTKDAKSLKYTYELTDAESKEKYQVEVEKAPPDGFVGLEYYNLQEVPAPTVDSGTKDEEGNPILQPVAGYYMIGLWRGTEKDIPDEFTPFMVEEFGHKWG